MQISYMIQSKKKTKWINIKFGQALIFFSSINARKFNKSNKKTRWSFNCRFKSLMSPYDKKDIAKLLPISIRPTTNFGMYYEEPTTK